MTEKLRVLFISGELIAGDLAYRLKQEGCDVKLYIEDESRRDCFGGMVEKIDDWKKELIWVGKNGLIVFDDVGYGKVQDDLRKEGYNVVGGSEGGDNLELDRDYGHKIFSTCGIGIVPTKSFDDIDEAISFVKEHLGKWVIKQNDHQSSLNYVGQFENGNDVICTLENYKGRKIKSVNLQERIEGTEIGVARYFNGNDWVGPIEFNIEHKALHNDNIGPKTGEMGTLIWYDNDENNKLFQETLGRLKSFLRHVNFKGDVDINCIINEGGVFPIEATSRFGCPSTQLQVEMHLSPWKDFLMAVAKGEKYELKTKGGFGIAISVCIPPFPYKSIDKNTYLRGANILFRDDITKEDLNSIHYEEVSLTRENDCNSCVVAGNNGFILYVTGAGDTIEGARKNAYSIVKKIVIPQMFYRTDIGVRFMNYEQKKLRELNWIK